MRLKHIKLIILGGLHTSKVLDASHCAMRLHDPTDKMRRKEDNTEKTKLGKNTESEQSI
jgi:hypothetical protein